MKKTLLVLLALCVAGIFSAKAQSSSDSSYARDLSYTFFNMSSLPNSVTGDLSTGSKILKDVRIGKRAIGYAITVTQNTALDIQLLSGGSSGWDSYLYLLDANFSEVTSNDDWNGSSHGSRITTQVNAGQYYVLVSEYSRNTTSCPYTLTIDQITITPINQLTYTPITLPDTLLDTFHTSYPNVLGNGNNDFYKAKGYSFQGTQGNILFVYDGYYNAKYILMDNNRNIIAQNNYLFYALPNTGTYYLAILDKENYHCDTYIKEINTQNIPTVYVDGVNGSDSRNGLTPQTAVFTLDTAIARTGGIGKYYITDDYTFRNQLPLTINYAEIYPYQKDIKLKIASTDGYDIIGAWPGHLVFGEQGSSYYFILDSNNNQNYNNFLNADASGSYLEVNNLKVRNTHFPSTAFWGDQIILRNCEFTNDTSEDAFIALETDYGNSVKFINCNISQNIIFQLFYFDYDSAKVTFENTTVSGNTFSWVNLIWSGAIANLTSGTWSNNRLSTDYSYNNNPNISAQTSAGIWFNNSTVNIGAGFSMDANNYICLDSTSIINVNQNLTASQVATVYPMKWDESAGKYVANYYEGRQLLSGSAVAANYRKFGVAQADNSSMWYLHSDGKIYTTEEPVGINTATKGTISLYPNPATNVLNITLEGTDATQVTIIDVYGKTVVTANVADGQNTIDVTELANGMYFVQLRNAGSIVATQKIVKN